MTVVDMKKYIILISAFVSLMSFSGCNDDAFLKENPKYFYTPDNIFSTASQVDQVLVSCYSHIRQMYCIEINYYTLNWSGSNGTDMFDIPVFRRGNTFNDYSTINPDISTFDTSFKQWFYLVSKANLALRSAQLDGIYWGSEADRAYAIAQAKFFRAWAYLNLGELFGGVPIVDAVVDTPRYDFVRSTRVETYQYAIDNLESCLNDFPATPPSPGRIAKGAAQHALMELYLDKGIALEEDGKTTEAKAAYQKAIDYGDALIDGGVHSLMTERFGKRKNEGPVYYYANNVGDQTPAHTYAAAGVNIQGNVFWDMFQEGNTSYQAGNKESIWTISANYDAFATEDGSAGFNFSRTYGPVFRDACSNYCNGSMEDVGGHGVCFIMPTMYTRDIIYQDKWGNDMRNSEACLRRTFIGNVPGNEWYGKVIPWSVLYREGGSVDEGRGRVFPVSCKISSDRYPAVALGSNRTMLFRDQYAIRLGESILLRAEAKMRNGDKSGAASDINMLRSRAKCGYMVTAADINVDLILDERARELVYEEHRWNTLLRMGGTVAVDRIKKYAYWNEPRNTLKKDFNLWPIPQNVIDSNKDAVIEQNPGWN